MTTLSRFMPSTKKTVRIQATIFDYGDCFANYGLKSFTRETSQRSISFPSLLFQGCVTSFMAKHGRDLLEVHGENRKYNRIRRLMSPWVDRYITVSRDLQTWLSDTVGIPVNKISQIYNGVDTKKFSPPPKEKPLLPAEAGQPDHAFVIGTVGRMEGIKDQITLVQSFIQLCQRQSDNRKSPFLVLVGDGSLRKPARNLFQEAGLLDKAWLAGSRDDGA